MATRKAKSGLAKMDRLLGDLFTVTKDEIVATEAKRPKRPPRKRKTR